MVSSLEKKIDALDRKHDETSSNISEQLKECASSDYEIVSSLAAENERLKVSLYGCNSTHAPFSVFRFVFLIDLMYHTSQALVSSLEKENSENDGNDSSNEQKEGTHVLNEEILTEDVLVDEMANKLAAENKDLYVSFFTKCILLH